MHYPKSMCDKAKSGDKESIALILLDAPDMPMDMKMKPEEYAMKMVDESYAEEDEKSESEDNPFEEIFSDMGLPDKLIAKLSDRLMEAKEAGKI